MGCCSGAAHFDQADVVLSAHALSAYALGLPAFVLVKVLAPGFFARGDMATPVKIGVAAVALNLALNLAFMRPLQQMGPALATSVAALFNLGGLAVVLTRRGHLRLDPALRRRAPRMLAAAAAMAVVLVVVQHLLGGALATRGVLRWAALAGLVAAGGIAYFGARPLFGAYRRAPGAAPAHPAPLAPGRGIGHHPRRLRPLKHRSMARIFSGIQPSGIPTLGNYLGAIRNWVTLQDAHECLWCVVDLHAITVWQEPAALARQTREMAAVLLACGVDPARHVVVPAVARARARAAWRGSSTAWRGWAG